MVSESPNVRLSTTTPHYQVEIVGSFDSKCRLLSTGSMFWQQRSQHCLSFSPSTPPCFHNSLDDCVLVYLLSSRKRCVHLMCVMSIAHVNCVVCDKLCVRTCNSKVWIYTLCERVVFRIETFYQSKFSPATGVRWGWVFLERTRILGGIQFTTYFIEISVVETKRFVNRKIDAYKWAEWCPNIDVRK